MTPAIPSSTNAFSLVPATTLTTRKNNCLTRCSILRKSSKQTLAMQKYILPLSTSVRLFSQFSGGCKLHFQSKIHLVSATETDVAVQESDSPLAEGDPIGNLEIPADAAKASENSSLNSEASPAPARSKRSRPVRKSEMPPVNNDLLVPGATFNGKVRSIQPFGAFVDFGAFTDGLVHVSQLSDSFVKDVTSVVSVGQEVKVRLVEANMDTGRISLTMRSSNDIGKLQQQKDAPSSGDKTRSSRKSTTKPNQKKDEVRKSSKFVKGQDLEGTVKNLTRSGAFISLPEGEEGFLPASEQADEGFGNVMGSSSLQAGQEVSVRVLRINRGQVTLTMKKEDDFGALDANVVQGVVHTATNPFLLAFRRNKELAAFLDEREKEEEPTEDSQIPEISGEDTTVDQIESMLGNTEVQDQSVSSEDSQVNVDLVVEDDDTSAEEVDVGVSSTDEESLEVTTNNEELEKSVSDSLPSVDGAVDSIKKEAEVNSEVSTPEANAPVVDEKTESPNVVESNKESDSSLETASQTSSAGILVSDDVTEEEVNETIAKDEVQMQTPTTESSIDSVTEVERTTEPEPQTYSSITSSNEQSDVLSSEETSIKETRVVDVENQVDNTLSKDLGVAQVPAADSAATIESEKPGPLTGDSSAGSNSNSTGQNGAPQEEAAAKAAISAALVKQLREETGAGMMDCKRALSETSGDLVKAQEYLRKKGLASADKKASRATAEGRIGSYIHDSRIGVLIEVNCETDFVSRGDIFKELVDDLAMQVAACPQVQYLVTDDVAKEIVDKEREIEMQKEDILSKPEQIRSKIVEGRIRKRLEELALLEQPYIRNDKIVVKDWVKQTIATIGENIKVNRFVRYDLGEGLEKKSQDFAAEVAAQATAQPMPSTVQEQSAVIEAKETVEKPQKAAVSAALVKQLREETGAGMMDCKKALSETGGDLEKAQEYLRKKGLSTADKKSSRLAAEGRIGYYIHDSRIGVLIEVNCETDFVGRNENFKELVNDLAMQVVACPQVQYVSIEDIPESIVNKEKELEMQREDLLSKPENIRERIVEGRVTKRLGELALLEQPYIKNDALLVKDLVKRTVAALGENIKVRRFVRFTLGETNDAKVESGA